MAIRKVSHPTLEERRDAGRLARKRTPRSSLEGWQPADDRPDPVGLLAVQNETREADLVPVRHGRMMVSPFTFYRGGAKIMAADLAHVPTAGIDVQLCGDAHASNFGGYASPERTLLFDLNDFDETLPGPFEYDLARLAASFVVASRDNGFERTAFRGGRGRLSCRVSDRDGPVRRDAKPRRVVLAPRCGGDRGDGDRYRQEEQPETCGGGTEERREGPDQGQSASAIEARRGGRRSASDHQRSPRGGPGSRPGPDVRFRAGGVVGGRAGKPALLPQHPARTTAAACSSGSS